MINSQAFESGVPFEFGNIMSFLDEDFAAKLETELQGLYFYRKSNDLYSFGQTKDLNSGMCV
jgi:hypothetical protein